ncbi:MAG: right-handed parallel beta-helix repeat-containing protein [Candidatus Aerophobetes bacterium]|nr:right-handed parallel beta-helix repeat-containing protein [Candidatus Aerophobetes bacterium]
MATLEEQIRDILKQIEEERRLGDKRAEQFYDFDRKIKTGASWSKTIGSGGDYATFADAMADMPDLIAHETILTILKGTTLNEVATIQNKHGLTADAKIIVKSEKYFPTTGAIPTATSGDATHLYDTAQSWTVNEFVDCWVFIVDGTGTNNGFVKITANTATSLTVAGWTTTPDATSKYLIIGALIDGATRTRKCMGILQNTVSVYLGGLGFKDGYFSTQKTSSTWTREIYCGHYGARYGAIVVECIKAYFRNCGIVNNHIENSVNYAGVRVEATNYGYIQDNAFSDNSRQAILVNQGAFAYIANNFGDANGLWGTYAKYSGQARMYGTECSGSSGNHSNGIGDGSLAY